jgi:tetratricopeptide (TPR) repeat protein
MRSAERFFLPLLAAAALAGCGSIGWRPLVRSAPVPTAAASAPVPVASAPAPAAAVPAAAAPVAPAARQAFDAALAALHAGRTADAERGFRALAQSDPELAGPHANLGLIARQAGRLPEAVSELERATQLAPQQPVAWNQLGIAYRQQGQFEKSREAYEHALALDANYATAVLNLGVLDDLYLGDSAKALELYTRYLALTPAGDPAVAKWVADLKNRKPAAAPAGAAPASAPKEKS